MSDITFNLREFNSQLDRILPDVLARAAELVKQKMISLAPRETGRLRSGITTKEEGFVVSIGPDKDTFYAKFAEFGAGPHQIGGGGQVLRIGGSFVKGPVSHPGVRARPFMRPALDQSVGDVLKFVEEQLSEML